MEDFESCVDRQHIGNMKDVLTPQALKDQHITSFAAAEMDFKTAPSVIRSVTEMVQNGVYGFTIPTTEYKNAVKWWLGKVRNWEIADEWIVPVLGTIFSIATAIRMTTKEDEGIIVQSPVYYRYEQAARRMNRKTVYNNLKIADGNYVMDYEDLEKKWQIRIINYLYYATRIILSDVSGKKKNWSRLQNFQKNTGCR